MRVNRISWLVDSPSCDWIPQARSCRTQRAPPAPRALDLRALVLDAIARVSVSELIWQKPRQH